MRTESPEGKQTQIKAISDDMHISSNILTATAAILNKLKLRFPVQSLFPPSHIKLPAHY